MANGVTRRNGNGNGEWEGEFDSSMDEGWWPGTSTEAATIPPTTPVVPPVNDWTVGGEIPVETPGTSVPFQAPELPTPVEPPAWLPMQGGAPPGLTETPGTSGPLEVPGISMPAQPPALAPFPQAPPGLTQITEGFQSEPQEFLEEGEFPIDEEAAGPLAQFKAQMKTPESRERMFADQQRRNDARSAANRGPLIQGPIQRQDLNLPVEPSAWGVNEAEGPPAPQEFLEEGEFPIEEEAADPQAQITAQMKTPEYRDRLFDRRWQGQRSLPRTQPTGTEVPGSWVIEEQQGRNLEAPLGGQVQLHEHGGDVDPNVALNPSTSAWAQQTPTDPSFQEWLGRGAPTGREWGAGTEESLGNLNWNPESGKWEDLQYQPWQYSGGREGPSPWVGRPQVGDIADEVGDYPTAGGEDFPLRDLGALAGGTGIYAPGEELGPVAGAEHRGQIRGLWDEFQETPFGGGGIVGFPGRAENLSDFEQDYNRRVGEMQTGQETQRGRYGDIETAMRGTSYTDPYTGEVTQYEGDPTVSSETGIVDPWTDVKWRGEQLEGAEAANQQRLDAAAKADADAAAAKAKADADAAEKQRQIDDAAAAGAGAGDGAGDGADAAAAQAEKDAEQARLDKERADREADAEAKRLSDEEAAKSGRAGADVPDLPDVDTQTEGVSTVLDQVDPAEGVTPWRPPEYEATATIPIGTSPLDQLADADLATLLQTGGVAPTPVAGETERTLTDILQGRGADAARPVGAGIDVQREIKELLANAGAMPEDQRMRAMELETARTPLDALRRAQLAQGSAAMAERGILGMGPETEYRERLESRLAPSYAQAGQQLELAQRERENERYLEAVRTGEAQSTQQAQMQEQSIGTALQLATGMSAEQSRNLLNTVTTLNERQEMQNNIALESLDRNIEWNKFLAEFGLQRDMVIELIQQKKFDQLLPLVQAYMNSVTSAAEGVVEPMGG